MLPSKLRNLGTANKVLGEIATGIASGFDAHVITAKDIPNLSRSFWYDLAGRGGAMALDAIKSDASPEQTPRELAFSAPEPHEYLCINVSTQIKNENERALVSQSIGDRKGTVVLRLGIDTENVQLDGFILPDFREKNRDFTLVLNASEVDADNKPVRRLDKGETVAVLEQAEKIMGKVMKQQFPQVKVSPTLGGPVTVIIPQLKP